MFEILLALLIASAVSGVVPVVNAELLVVAAAAAVPAVGLPLVAAVSTAGQMSTKTALFVVARWAPHRLPVRARAALDRAGAAVEDRGGAASSVVFASAATGLPPFFGVSLASGALGMRLSRFVTAGTLGRFCRFSVLAGLGRVLGG